MSKIRVVMNKAGVQAVLKSAEIQQDLLHRAETIAEQAGDGMLAKVDVGKTRARAVVITDTEDAIVAEATNRSLTNAIDAGR